jgi:hypothetical protein
MNTTHLSSHSQHDALSTMIGSLKLPLGQWEVSIQE